MKPIERPLFDRRIYMGRFQAIEADARLRMETTIHLADYDRKAVGQAACAFLNGQGGRILIGVDSQGVSTPLVRPERILEELEEQLARSIHPRARISVTVARQGEHEIVVVRLAPGTELPYLFDDEIYVLKDHAPRSGSNHDLSKLIDKRRKVSERWERQIAFGASLRDLDLTAIHDDELPLPGETDPLREKSTNPYAILERLRLADGGQLLNSSVVLFGLRPTRFYSQTQVRAASYPMGRNQPAGQDVTFEDNLIRLVPGLLDFLRQNVPVADLRQDNTYPKSGTAYPMPALYEGVLNALTHRDYAAFDGGVQIVTDATSVSIWNSGRLPKGITVKDLPIGTGSRPQNPDIAYVLWRRKYIERLGHGGVRIAEACRLAGLSPPVWSIERGGVLLRFKLRRENTPSDATQ